MSFDISFSFFDHEEKHRIPKAALHARFAKHIESEEENGCWRLVFDEGPTFAEVSSGKDDFIGGFVVRRPPEYLEFWEIVAGILRDLPCLLYWPNVPPLGIVGSLDMLQHIPKGFIEAMGIPWVSTDPERIRQYVRENS